MKEIVKYISSPEEMHVFGGLLARKLGMSPLILALRGDLGSGKTTFLKGFISALTSTSPDEIQSPTFTYLQVYQDLLYHFDLYRIKNFNQFESAGFTEYLSSDKICCIEWAERIEDHLPDSTYFLDITYVGPTLRKCSLYQKRVL